MAYRPYPNADRALRQVERHAQPRQPSESQLRMAEQAHVALAAAGAAIRPLADMAQQLRNVHVTLPRIPLSPEQSACGVHISVIRAAEYRARMQREQRA